MTVYAGRAMIDDGVLVDGVLAFGRDGAAVIVTSPHGRWTADQTIGEIVDMRPALPVPPTLRQIAAQLAGRLRDLGAYDSADWQLLDAAVWLAAETPYDRDGPLPPATQTPTVRPAATVRPSIFVD